MLLKSQSHANGAEVSSRITTLCRQEDMISRRSVYQDGHKFYCYMSFFGLLMCDFIS